MFDNNAEYYFDKDMAVLPLNGKRPFTSDWVNHNFEGENHPLRNIGLKTGKHSGVICIDIDTTDNELKKKIYALLPPLYSGKVGNKKKGNNYFFKYNGEQNRKIGGVVELLSTGNQTVLPPSMHPEEKYAYEWIGIPLLEADELPDLPSDFISNMETLLGRQNTNTEIIKSDGRRCNHGSHNKLSQILVASIHDGENIDDIVNKLIEYDDKINPTISYFVCPSRKEWRSNNIKINAHKFVLQAYERHVNEGKVKDVGSQPLTIQPKKRERKKYPHLRGIMQEMFQYVYDNSPVPRSRFALASALSAMSVVLGNKIRCGDIYPNLYSLMISPSGGGKDFPLKFPKKLLMKAGHTDLIGQAHPASDSGLILTLPTQQVRIDTIDEADILFGAINNQNNSYATKMADVYATLYTSCGEYYEGKVLASHKSKRIGACHSPYVTLISAMTPNAFRDSFTVKTVEKGLGGRFLYFIDEDYKKSKPMVGAADIPGNLIRFTKMWRDLATDNGFKMENGQNIISVNGAEMTKSAKAQLDEAHEYMEGIKTKTRGDDKMMPILNRGYTTIVKLALMDAVSIDPFSTDITIKKESVSWAMAFYGVHFRDMREFFEVNVSGSQNERLSNIVLEKIKKAGSEGITSSMLCRVTRSLTGQHRKAIITELVESDVIVASKSDGKTKPVTKYYSKDHIVVDNFALNQSL